MTKPEFRVLLIATSFEATRFGQRYVTQTLPFVFRYRAHLNSSFDGHALPEDVLYPEDEGKLLDLDSEEQAVDLLCRDGRCPEWIDIMVHAVSPGSARLRVECCGRFTTNPERLYYRKQGFGPFGVKSPTLPPKWSEGMRFSIANV